MGASNCSADRWDAAQSGLGVPVLSDQVRCSLLDRRPERGVLTRARATRGVPREVAAAHDASPAQVALARLVDHDRVLATPGASSVAQLESAAADTTVAADERAAPDAASAAYRPVGAGRTLLSAVRPSR